MAGRGVWKPSPHPSSAAGMLDTNPHPSLQKDLFFWGTCRSPGDPRGHIEVMERVDPDGFAHSMATFLPPHYLQSLSRRLSPRQQLHLEGKTLAAEPAGCSPGPFTACPAPPLLRAERALSPTVLRRYLQGR